MSDLDFDSLKKTAEKKRLLSYTECCAAQDVVDERFGVHSSFIGLKEVEGKWTKQVALICNVSKKKPVEKLSRNERIPKTLSFKVGQRNCKLKTDVVANKSKFTYQAIFNPGDRVTRSSSKATVGAYATHPTYGSVFITAGHFAHQAGGKGKVVELRDNTIKGAKTPCKIIEYVINDYLDYAILKPKKLNNRKNQYSDSSLNSIYNPETKSDLGKTLYVVARGKAIKTSCVGVRMRYKVNDTFTLKDLIVTPRVTNPGDSGAALVDRELRVWGFLIGAIGKKYSVFMPSIKLVQSEHIILGE